jgi:hypothetical protein
MTWVVAFLVAMGAISVAGGALLAAQGEKAPGQFPWGISSEELRRGQQEPPDPGLSRKDFLVFRSKVVGEDALLEYVFTEDRLTRVRWVVAKYLEPQRYHQKIAPGQCIRDYLQIRKRLTKRYGEPRETAAAGSRGDLKASDLSLDIKDPERLWLMEQTIRRGAALWYTMWKTEDTSAVLLLTGGQGALSLAIDYSGLAPGQRNGAPPRSQDR